MVWEARRGGREGGREGGVIVDINFMDGHDCIYMYVDEADSTLLPMQRASCTVLTESTLDPFAEPVSAQPVARRTYEG